MRADVAIIGGGAADESGGAAGRASVDRELRGHGQLPSAARRHSHYYRAHLPLTATARDNRRLNPGNGWVGRLCHDPRVAVAVWGQLMAPSRLSGRLLLLERTKPIAAVTDGDQLTRVVLRNIDVGTECVLEAPFFIDATPYGDLLAMAGIERVVGA
jgi:hypothetical protein